MRNFPVGQIDAFVGTRIFDIGTLLGRSESIIFDCESYFLQFVHAWLIVISSSEGIGLYDVCLRIKPSSNFR